MAPTSLYVRDLDAAVTWYRDVLGLEPMVIGEERHRYAAYQLGSSILVLEPVGSVPAEVQLGSPGSESVTVNLVVDRDPAEIREELLRRAVMCGQLMSSEHHAYFLMHDPDGNRFYVTRPVT